MCIRDRLSYMYIILYYIPNPNTKVRLDGVELQFSEIVKYLGIMLDFLLNFNEHIKYTSKKIAKKVGYLARVGRCLTKWTKKLVYQTIIAPHYEYCASIFLDANEKDIDILQKLQNKAMRVITKCDWYTHSKDMLQKLGWLSIKQQIKLKALKFIHSVVSSNKNDVFKNLYKLNTDIHKFNTRSSNNFHMFPQNNKTGQKSLFCNGLKEYNKLPQHIKVLNMKNFKKEVTEWIKNQY
jgi:hypothetical protein